MKKTIRLAIASLLAIGAFIGCDGDAGPKAPVVVTTTGEVAIDSTKITDGITNETVTTVDTKTNVAMTIPESTKLTFEDGTEVTTAPTTKTEVKKSTEKATTTLNFEVDGKKVIPSNPVTVSVPAPEGAVPGTLVNIEVPDNGNFSKSSARVGFKFISVKVKSDGTVSITIKPDAFRKVIVIVVVVIRDSSTN
jgi:hypothetical protein